MNTVVLKTKAPKLVRFILGKATTDAEAVVKIIEAPEQYEKMLLRHLRGLEKWIDKLQRISELSNGPIQFANDPMYECCGWFETSLRQMREDIRNLFDSIYYDGMRVYRKPGSDRIISIIRTINKMPIHKIPLGGVYRPDDVRKIIIDLNDEARQGKDLVEKVTVLVSKLSEEYLEKDTELNNLFKGFAEGRIECLSSDIWEHGFKAKKTLKDLLCEIDDLLSGISCLSYKVEKIEFSSVWDAAKTYITKNAKSIEAKELRESFSELQRTIDAYGSIGVYSDSVERLNFVAPYFWKK